jgi:hypothetical protein
MAASSARLAPHLPQNTRVRPQSARSDLTLRQPPPTPSISALNDAVARGCSNAAGRLQQDRAASLLLAPDAPPRPRLAPRPTDGHLLPAPSLGARASKAWQGNRPPNHPLDPELLHKLLHFVRQGLRGAEAGTVGYVEQRLDVFRRAFSHFIGAYGVYAPLLLGVQEAYEDALAHASARATGVDEVSERLALMQHESRQLLTQLEAEAAAERQASSETLSARDAKLHAAAKEASQLREEVKGLRNEVAHVTRQKEDIELRAVELAKQVEFWQAETVEAKRGGEVEKECERMRTELKQLADRERMLLDDDREQRTLFRETKHELEGLKANSVSRDMYKQSQDALARAQAGLKAAKAEVDELRRLLRGGESHELYPNGLQWAGEALDVAYLDPGWRGKRAHEIIADLVLDVLTLQHALQSHHAAQRAAGAPMFGLAPADLKTLRGADDAVAAAGGGGGGGGSGGSGVVGGDEATSEGLRVLETVELLQGEVSVPRASGSSFDGFVRVRSSLWSTAEVVEAVRRLWTAYRKHPQVLAGQGGARRGSVHAAQRFLRPEEVAQIMGEITSSYLTQRHDAAAADGRSPHLSTSKRDAAVHRGLLCADTYNLQAAMWRLRDKLPHAAIFVQVATGRLPPATFAELHKVCSNLYRGLTATSRNERVPLDTLKQKLHQALPGVSEVQREALFTTVVAEAGAGEKVSRRHSARPHLHPCPSTACPATFLPSTVLQPLSSAPPHHRSPLSPHLSPPLPSSSPSLLHSLPPPMLLAEPHIYQAHRSRANLQGALRRRTPESRHGPPPGPVHDRRPADARRPRSRLTPRRHPPPPLSRRRRTPSPPYQYLGPHHFVPRAAHLAARHRHHRPLLHHLLCHTSRRWHLLLLHPACGCGAALPRTANLHRQVHRGAACPDGGSERVACRAPPCRRRAAHPHCRRHPRSRLRQQRSSRRRRRRRRWRRRRRRGRR